MRKWSIHFPKIIKFLYAAVIVDYRVPLGFTEAAEFSGRVVVYPDTNHLNAGFQKGDGNASDRGFTVAGNRIENHYLETKIVNLNLAPGEKKENLIRVLPRKRRIRILQDGGILSEEKKGK